MSSAARRTHNGVKHQTPHKAGRPRHRAAPRTIRKQSARRFFGFPLWEVAKGPNPSKGERVGHARAVFAIGDVADGVVAIGGIARGVFCIGGLSFGLCSVGGISVGLAAAVGGVAVAPLALGGVALGLMSLGGTGYDMHGPVHPHAQAAAGGVSAYLPSFLRRQDRPGATQTQRGHATSRRR